MYIIEVPYFNLEKTYKTEQCIRWRKLNDNKFVIFNMDKFLVAFQNRDKLILNCSEEEFYSMWYEYFNLSKDYCELFFDVAKEKELKKYAVRAKGVHTLKRNLFEIFAIEILAEGREKQEVENLVNELCETCGQKKNNSCGDAGRITWYTFPNSEQIVAKKKLLSFNKRFNKLVSICELIQDGWFEVQEIEKLTLGELKEYFGLYDISENVAEKTYMYLHPNALIFPEDTDIKRLLSKELDCDNELFVEWYLSDIKKSMPDVWQIIKYCAINKPLEEIEWG